MDLPKLEELTKLIEKAGNRNEEQDDKDLAGLAETRFWSVLKDTVLLPKINDLLQISQNITPVLSGEMSKEAFGELVIYSRYTAGHLQDIINRVEAVHEYFVAENLKENEE